jgi:hypothetical protein
MNAMDTSMCALVVAMLIAACGREEPSVDTNVPVDASADEVSPGDASVEGVQADSSDLVDANAEALPERVEDVPATGETDVLADATSIDTTSPDADEVGSTDSSTGVDARDAHAEASADPDATPRDDAGRRLYGIPCAAGACDPKTEYCCIENGAECRPKTASPAGCVETIELECTDRTHCAPGQDCCDGHCRTHNPDCNCSDETFDACRQSPTDTRRTLCRPDLPDTCDGWIGIGFSGLSHSGSCMLNVFVNSSTYGFYVCSSF